VKSGTNSSDRSHRKIEIKRGIRPRKYLKKKNNNNNDWILMAKKL